MGAIGIQYFVTIIVSALLFMAAFSVVWPSYALRALEGPDSPLGSPITKYDANLIASVLMLGSLPAVLVIGYLNEKFGRKRSLVLCALCFVLAWAILTTAKTVTQIVIGRFAIGFASGMQMITGLIFISEISHTSLQGSLLAVVSFAFNIGSLTSYIQGWFCSYEVINYINLTISVGVVVLLCFLKETPPYLVRYGKEKEALCSLMFYRGSKILTQEISDELAYIRNQQQTSDSFSNSGTDDSKLGYEKVKLNENDVNDNNSKHSSWKILVTSKSSQRTLIILITQSVLTVFMGMLGIQAYAGQLFSRVAPDISPDLCSVVLAILITISSAVAMIVTDLIPRRVLMLTSSGISVTSMALMASMLYWSWAPKWFIPLLIAIFCVFFQLGPANVTFVQIGECIPPQLKSLSSPIVMCNILIINFILLYVFEPAVDAFGLHGVFCFFAIVGVLTIITVYFIMRETRKEPFENIQRMFEQGYIYRKN